ncbi:response regulator transcription factor [Actinoplanes siamensis]|uniref:response regulator transcription factor n=1 Tax=Actinoplanes siamensis TaxID=1223317 RepID=UPI001EF2133C|nr:helix-turn-helix transcriptional regulator [Actinoplanes siamensis]
MSSALWPTVTPGTAGLIAIGWIGRAATQGRPLLSAVATDMLIQRFPADRAAVPAAAERRLGDLTERELEVVALAAEGLPNEHIGQRLNLATLTVKTHVNRARTKLGVHDRAGLVVIAYGSGPVDHLRERIMIPIKTVGGVG